MPWREKQRRGGGLQHMTQEYKPDVTKPCNWPCRGKRGVLVRQRAYDRTRFFNVKKYFLKTSIIGPKMSRLLDKGAMQQVRTLTYSMYWCM